MLKRFLTLATLLAIGLTASVDAQRLIVSDSGAVEREISRLIVVDSGGTAREVDRAFVVDSGGTARLFYSGALVESATVTRGNIGGSIGYDDGSATGAISPDPFTVNGATTESILSSSFNGFDFRVNLVGTYAIDHFTQVVVDDESSVEQTFLTSAATRTTGSGLTTWTWGDGTSAVWTTGSGDRDVTFTTE